MSESKTYCDDHIQLSRYRNLLEALCSKELSRIRSMSYVGTIEDAVFEEQSHGVRVCLHETFCDNVSDALYEASYQFFVTYYGKFQLMELSIAPTSSAISFVRGGDLG